VRNIAVIGCGSIGEKRAHLIKDYGRLVAFVDTVPEKAGNLAKQFPGCAVYRDWQEVVNNPGINVIFIATLHASLAEIARAAVIAGKHVFIEKPGACNAKELRTVIDETKKNHSIVRVGFNHRYHRALRKARELIDQGELGELMFLRARYGHGGRLGYEQEWRADPALSGGGELLDQGVHLIDLARWFLGDFTEIKGCVETYYWDMPVDDNGFLLLKTDKKQVAFLHASCTEWKNIFSFEIYGRKGKIDINGLGGSYGVEKITFYQMLPEMGPPATFSWEYPMNDNSWEIEVAEFFNDIEKNNLINSTLFNAYAVLKIVDEIYQQEKITS